MANLLQDIQQLQADLMRAQCEYKIITSTATPIGQLLCDVIDMSFYFPTFGINVVQESDNPTLYTSTTNFARVIRDMDTKAFFNAGDTTPRDCKAANINFGTMIREGFPKLLKVVESALSNGIQGIWEDTELSTIVFGQNTQATSLLMHRKYFSAASATLGVSEPDILKQAEDLATIADRIEALSAELSKAQQSYESIQGLHYPNTPKDLEQQVSIVLLGGKNGTVRQLMKQHIA